MQYKGFVCIHILYNPLGSAVTAFLTIPAYRPASFKHIITCKVFTSTLKY